MCWQPESWTARVQTFALFARAGLDSFATAVPDPGSLSALVPYGEDGRARRLPIRYAFSSGQLRVYAAIRLDQETIGQVEDRLRPGAVVPAAALGYRSCGDRLDGFRCCLRTCCRVALTAASRSPC